MLSFEPSMPLTELSSYLDSTNAIYANDITLQAKNANGIIVGFICENTSPIRFVSVLTFGIDMNIFEDYRIYKSLISLTYIYNNTVQTIPSIANNEEAQSIQPYISTINNIVLPISTTAEIVVDGDFFDTAMNIDLGPSVTVNHFSLISPNQIKVNVTTSASEQTEYPIKITRGNAVHYGNTPTVLVTNDTIGNGPSGTYVFNPNAGQYGYQAFDGHWTLSTYGNCTINGFFRTSTSTTPSTNTGPTGYSGDVYLFTERSSPNYGSGNYGEMTTSYFRKLTEISFDLHMYGSSMCDFSILSLTSDNIWVERWIQHGNLQSSQSDPFSQIQLDARSWDAKEIKFLFSETDNYSSDVCLKNITITSE